MGCYPTRKLRRRGVPGPAEAGPPARGKKPCEEEKHYRAFILRSPRPPSFSGATVRDGWTLAMG